MPRRLLVVLVLTGLLFAACSANQSSNAVATQVNPVLKDALPPDVALNIQNQISEKMGVATENINLKQVEKMDWPNSCLGLPAGNEVCTETITPGWLLTFDINGQQYRYRVDKTGTVLRQEP